jgi:hypothetical protein
MRLKPIEMRMKKRQLTMRRLRKKKMQELELVPQESSVRLNSA